MSRSSVASRQVDNGSLRCMTGGMAPAKVNPKDSFLHQSFANLSFFLDNASIRQFILLWIWICRTLCVNKLRIKYYHDVDRRCFSLRYTRTVTFSEIILTSFQNMKSLVRVIWMMHKHELNRCFLRFQLNKKEFIWPIFIIAEKKTFPCQLGRKPFENESDSAYANRNGWANWRWKDRFYHFTKKKKKSLVDCWFFSYLFFSFAVALFLA